MGKIVLGSLRVSLQKLVVWIYFFFNSAGLKGGLLYTNILTPFLLIWINKWGLLKPFLNYSLVSIPFFLIHYSNGIQVLDYAISLALIFSTITFILAAHIYINNYPSLKATIQQLIVINFCFVLFAIPFYFFEPPYKSWFWYTNAFTTQQEFTRISLLTFEASYYALLQVPLVFYAIHWISSNQRPNHPIIWILISFLPFLATLSFGVLGASIASLGIIGWSQRKNLLKNSNKTGKILAVILLLLTILALLVMLFPNHILVQRVFNIFKGYDTSSRGRTLEAFQIAWLLAKEKSIWFGCGLGQSKLLLPEIIRAHFPLWGKFAIYRIPNTMAETLAVFGITGLLLRMSLIAYFFIKTKVWMNSFQLSLFLFIFIYQFTGSYLTNIVEYVIWLFAFSKAFPEFNFIQTLKNEN